MKIVQMPKAGQTVEESKILQWFYQEGEEVEKGQPLLEVETDKAALEVNAPASGVLRKILYEEGATVPVLKPVAVIAAANEKISEVELAKVVAETGPAAADAPEKTPAPAQAASSSATAAPSPAAATEKSPPADASPAAPTQTAPAAKTVDRLFTSPAARRAAKELGVDLSAVRGSAPGGRVVEADVKAHAAGAATVAGAPSTSPAGTPPAGGVRPGVRRPLPPLRWKSKAARGQKVPLSKMRRVIAERLAEAKRTVPHFYCRMEIDAGPLSAAARAAKAAFGASLNDVLAHTVVETLNEFPEVNARFLGDSIEYCEKINLGMATAVEEGLLVPVVEDAGRYSLPDLSREIKKVVKAARAGKSPGTGTGTFTVTNLGMFGLDEFAAVVNPPEAAILAVGAVKEKVFARGGGIYAGLGLTVTLSPDHRAIDGATAAAFLARLKERLEAL